MYNVFTQVIVVYTYQHVHSLLHLLLAVIIGWQFVSKRIQRYVLFVYVYVYSELLQDIHNLCSLAKAIVVYEMLWFILLGTMRILHVATVMCVCHYVRRIQGKTHQNFPAWHLVLHSNAVINILVSFSFNFASSFGKAFILCTYVYSCMQILK